MCKQNDCLFQVPIYNSILILANPDQIDKAKELIKKLQFKFSSDSFENPVLQQYWRNIEALALDRDAPEEMTDYTCMYMNGVVDI